MIAAYLRYSSDNQRDNLSLSTQREAVSRFVRSHFPDNQKVVEYVDEAESGMQHDRPGYQAMLSAARAGGLSAIVVYKYDRLGRNQIDQVLALEELEERLGVEVHSATEPGDVVVRGILGVIAEFESRKLGQRVKDANRQAVREGYCAGRAPYGYRIERVQVGSRTRGKFIVSTPESEIVRRIFEQSASGKSYRSIVSSLNENGVRAPGGSEWDVSAVQYILHNETYLGRMVRGAVELRGLRDGSRRKTHNPRGEWAVSEHAHQAIIGQELWDAVHSRLAKHAECGGGRKSTYLLSGVLRCAECGGAFIAWSKGSGERRQYAYRCGRRRSRGVCGNDARINGRSIEKQMLGSIMTALSGLADSVSRIVADQIAASERDEDQVAEELSTLERRIARVNSIIADCPADAVDGLKQELWRLSERRRELSRLRPASGSVSADELRAEAAAEIAAMMTALQCTDDMARAHEVMASVVESAVVERDGTVRAVIRPHAGTVVRNDGVDKGSRTLDTCPALRLTFRKAV